MNGRRVLKKERELLVTQGHHRINAHRAPARDVAGEQCDSEQGGCDGHESHRISRGHAVQEHDCFPALRGFVWTTCTRIDYLASWKMMPSV
jgi:hypothetical protein